VVQTSFKLIHTSPLTTYPGSLFQSSQTRLPKLNNVAAPCVVFNVTHWCYFQNKLSFFLGHILYSHLHVNLNRDATLPVVLRMIIDNSMTLPTSRTFSSGRRKVSVHDMKLKKIRTTPLDGKPQGSQYNSPRPPTAYAPPSRSETTPTPAAGLVPGQP